MNVSVYCHLDGEPNASILCRTESGRDYPVLSLGPVRLFPTDEQLLEVHRVIGEYFTAKEARAYLEVFRCDHCGQQLPVDRLGQSTADSVVCRGCILKALAGLPRKAPS